MAYSAPTTRSQGEFITPAIWNQDIVDNQTAAFPLGAAGLSAAWTSWTPTITQSVSVPFTNHRSVYTRVGRMVTALFALQPSGGGTTNNALLISVPVAAASAVGGLVSAGSGQVFDTSTSTRYGGVWTFNSVNNLFFVGDWSGTNVWGINPNLPISTNDLISGIITYEAAS